MFEYPYPEEPGHSVISQPAWYGMARFVVVCAVADLYENTSMPIAA